MIEAYQRAAYESPMAAMLGPMWSAVFCGFAVVIFGSVYITPSGERYLATKEPK